jgi:3'5'-cyclic nucleotide phosphodiesterase
MNVVESAILSTDLAMYFKKRDKFLELIDNGEFDWQSDEKKERKLIKKIELISAASNFNFNFTFISFSFHTKCIVLCGMMMTACDVS